jgi:sn-glycerol 3-phosphate transport system substrate-binding protein
VFEPAQPHPNRRRLLGGIVALGSLTAASVLLQACGAAQPAPVPSPTAAPVIQPATPTPAPAQAAPAATGQMKVLYWGSFAGDLDKAEQEVVNRYNKSQDKIALDYQFQGSYAETAQKLSAALAAKQAPDVSILSDVWWQKYWLGKQLAPMNPFMTAAKVSATDYVDSFITEGTRNGNIYWIPFACSTPLYYYNKDIFKAAGFDNAPATWDDLISMGDKLAKRDGDKISVAAFAHANGASNVAWVFQPVVWQHGGRYSDDQYNITIDQSPAPDASQLYGDLIWKYKLATYPKDVVVDFTSGVAASMMASTANLGTIEKNARFAVGTAFLPQKKQFGCCIGGSGFGLLATSSQDKQAAAFDYVRFATSDDTTTYWSQTTGYMPVRKTAIASDQMAALYKQRPNFQTAVKQLEKTRPQDWARVGIPTGDQIIGQGPERILVNHEEAQAVFKNVAATLKKEGDTVLRQLKALSS